MWYAKFMFTLVNLTCIIFLYKHAKDGLEWPRFFFGNLYSSECTSWNNPNGQKNPLIYFYNFVQ
jgi:hypothetical protein